jgi:predicted nucleic acid-binding protein
MTVLVDTGVLLRLLTPADPQHVVVRQAVRSIKGRGDRLVTSPQNAAEFWNVCTRPSTARGGLGLTIAEADRRLRIVERLFPVLPDSPAAYPLWRQLVVSLGVMGVQVHDARLVALMMAHGIAELLTLNAADFSRYLAVRPLTPASIFGTSP